MIGYLTMRVLEGIVFVVLSDMCYPIKCTQYTGHYPLTEDIYIVHFPHLLSTC